MSPVKMIFNRFQKLCIECTNVFQITKEICFFAFFHFVYLLKIDLFGCIFFCLCFKPAIFCFFRRIQFNLQLKQIDIWHSHPAFWLLLQKFLKSCSNELTKLKYDLRCFSCLSINKIRNVCHIRMSVVNGKATSDLDLSALCNQRKGMSQRAGNQKKNQFSKYMLINFKKFKQH